MASHEGGNGNFLVIVEGPAGSGKSTLAKAISSAALRKGIEAPLIQQSLSSRNPLRSRAIRDSLLNDLGKVAAATLEKGPAIVDRLVISQWVYDQLRTERYERPLHWVETKDVTPDFFHLQVLELCGFLNRHMEMRAHFEHSFYLPEDVLFVFMIPSAEEIWRRRAMTERTFKYKPEQEVDAYWEVFCKMRDGAHPAMHVVGGTHLLEEADKVANFLVDGGEGFRACPQGVELCIR